MSLDLKEPRVSCVERLKSCIEETVDNSKPLLSTGSFIPSHGRLGKESSVDWFYFFVLSIELNYLPTLCFLKILRQGLIELRGLASDFTLLLQTPRVPGFQVYLTMTSVLLEIIGAPQAPAVV